MEIQACLNMAGTWVGTSMVGAFRGDQEVHLLAPLSTFPWWAQFQWMGAEEE